MIKKLNLKYDDFQQIELFETIDKSTDYQISLEEFKSILGSEAKDISKDIVLLYRHSQDSEFNFKLKSYQDTHKQLSYDAFCFLVQQLNLHLDDESKEGIFAQFKQGDKINAESFA